MRKIILILLMVIGPLTGLAEEVVTFDFSTNVWDFPTSKPEATELRQYTDGEKTITINDKPYHESNYVTFQGNGTYLELPAFDFIVTRIEVDAAEPTNENSTQNIYIEGDHSVSTKTTGGKGTYTYEIQEEYRMSGTLYRIKPYSTNRLYISQIRVYGEKNYSPIGISHMKKKSINYNGGNEASINNDEGFNFHFEKGTNSTGAFFTSDTNFRFFQGNIFTITAPNGKIITSICFDGDNNNLSVNKGTFLSTTNTWSGLATSITFENNTNTNANYSDIKIIYSDLYSRTTTVDELGTICLDKDVKEGEYSGAKFYEISYREGNRLYFEEVTSLKSGYPYLFQATDTEIKMAVHGNVSTEGKSKNGFHGVLADFPFNGTGSGFCDGDYFVVTGNKIVAASNESGVRANRAFIVKSEIPTEAPTSDAKKNMICLDDDSNGISVIPSSDTDADIYDLSGRKVYKPAHGIYIKEGKKIIY